MNAFDEGTYRKKKKNKTKQKQTTLTTSKTTRQKFDFTAKHILSNYIAKCNMPLIVIWKLSELSSSFHEIVITDSCVIDGRHRTKAHTCLTRLHCKIFFNDDDDDDDDDDDEYFPDRVKLASVQRQVGLVYV